MDYKKVQPKSTKYSLYKLTLLLTGAIEVKFIDQEYDEIVAISIISIDDKEKIEPILNEIVSLDKTEIKNDTKS